jgi:thiamine-monophosphate kinase
MRRSAEFDLIARFRERLASTASGSAALNAIGDDAALTAPRGVQVTSIDAIVDGVHFQSSWCEPRDAGRKAMGSALSDLAAMGARAGEAYVWLGAPAELSDDDCMEICEGIAELAEATGTAVLGGDLTASPVLALSVTAVGHAERAEQLVPRSGALPGAALCVTGALGGAAAGLLALERPELASGIDRALVDSLAARLLRPRPLLAAGRALAAAGAAAMIDVSDGLLADAEHIAAASEVGIEIDAETVPVAPGVAEIAAAAGRDAVDLALAGGEDYELLVVVSAGGFDSARAAARSAGADLLVVGAVEAGAGVRLRRPGGRDPRGRGFDHRGSRSAPA